MNRIKHYIALLLLSISPFFAVKDIYCFFIVQTESDVNTITISQDTSYTVVHELMDLNGTTYTMYGIPDTISAKIGDVITPDVLNLNSLNIVGFNTPSVQTVTLDSYTNKVITYRYPRKQYTLSITNSGYVTTSTPSGKYYHGQVIHLVADATDNNGNPFMKWSDNTTNPDYTFTMTGNVTVGPIYTSNYKITYQPNNGDSSIIDYVPQNHSLGSMPTILNNDCVGNTGDYHTRGCTYYYKFEGWYKESTYVNQVNESFIPTGDTTLYAKWNKMYFEEAGPFTCDGTNSIDTGVKMFNTLNGDKDFIIKFTVDQNNGYESTSGDRGSIFADMREGTEPFPGVHFFTDGTSYTMNINTQGNKKKNNNTGYVTGQSVEIKKVAGKVYYSYDGGNDVQFNDFSNFSPNFDNPALFCAGINQQGEKYRFFKGVLSDMSVELVDYNAYTLHFDANGGTGMMIDQVVKLGEQTTINANIFTNNDSSFGGWNTAIDGTGTSYPNNYAITSDLGNLGDTITLYAQWIHPMHYSVHFDANGGTGMMSDQTFTISDVSKPLSANTFVRTGYEFRGWNTASDGSGTHYDDEEAVRDLSSVDEDVVTLYAEWWKIQYSHPGDAIFDGTLNTFINTGVNVFSSTNINKDFEIRFTFKSVDSDLFTVSPTQPTFFNVKDESNNKYPGFNIRFNSDINKMFPTYRWGGSTINEPSGGILVSNAPIDFIYKRKNGVITMQYSYGNTTQTKDIITQSSWTLNQAFTTNVAFGGFFDSTNTPGRFFKGVLSDMIILMDD